MFVRIDHIMICVPELARGIEQYTNLGFNIYPGGVHTGKGTHNAISFNEDEYLELLAIRDHAEYLAGRSPGHWNGSLDEFIGAGGGIRFIILQSDDLAAEVAAMRARGVDVGDATEGARRTPDGRELRWKSAVLGPKNPLPLFFIEHITPVAQRRKQVPVAGRHPNGVFALERTYVVVEDAAKEAATYAHVLGVSRPPLQNGTVIMANMAVFQFGPHGLGIAQPYAAGPAAEALERRGHGPFQALYRTTSIGAADRWIRAHGLPPPARGVRNTGEHALLVSPPDACGTYIGFVGPE